MRFKAIVTGLGLVLLCSQSLAAPDGKGRGKIFKHLDTDSDGFISQEEFKLPKDRRFKHVDTDEDGSISLQEFEAKAAQRDAERREKLVEHFASMDLDGDGYVTDSEMKLSAFNRMDENGDGLLSKDEMRPPKRRHGEFRGRPDHDD